MSIYNIAENIIELLELIENDDTDNTMLADTLEALEGELEYKINSWCNVIKNKESDIEGITKEIKRLQEKKFKAEKNIKKMKASLCILLERLGYSNFKTPTYNLNRFRESLEINTKEVPEEYKVEVEKVVKEVNKDRIKEDLSKGEKLSFAKYIKSLTIQ